MKAKNSAWIIISLLTLITAVVWLGVTIRSTLNKETVPENLEEITKPLNPSLDSDIFVKLKQRNQ